MRRDDNGGTDYGHRVTAYELNDLEVRDNTAQSAGSDVDSLIDTPTNYSVDSGNAGGNYCTINPLQTQDYSSGSPVIANGNLEIDTTGTGWSSAAGTIAVSSGKYYWEYTCSNLTGSELIRNGIFKQGGVLDGTGGDQFTSPDVYNYASNAQKWTGSGFTSYGASYTTGDVIGVALDLDAGTLTFYKNGSSQGSAYTGLSGTFSPYFAQSSDPKSLVNFGARPFAHTPPSNHLALVTTNLSDPTIADGSTAFDAKLFIGNGSTQTISGFNFSPDFVWIKSRPDAYGHALYDQIRGAGKRFKTHTSDAEQTQTNGLTSFTSDGFALGDNVAVNDNADQHIAWAWDAGTSTASNTDGSITSSVRANASAGISVVGFTGNGSAATIGHGLNAAPELILLKNRQTTQLWYVYSKELGAGKYLHLHTTAAQVSDVGMWNNVEPTSSVFTVGSYALSNNYIAYCFTPVEGFSAFGSYEGNGSSSDGTFVFTGMRPAFVLVKNADNADDWCIADTSRSSHNVQDETLFPNTAGGEDTGSFYIDILSNGFKPRNNTGKWNSSGHTFIYAAFAEHPQKTARAR